MTFTISLIPGVLGSIWAMFTSSGVASAGHDQLNKKNICNEVTVTSWKARSRVRKKLPKNNAKPTTTAARNNAPANPDPLGLPALGLSWNQYAKPRPLGGRELRYRGSRACPAARDRAAR